MASKTPEKTFRIGLVSASVFVNEVDGDGGKREIRNVNLQRRYREWLINGSPPRRSVSPICLRPFAFCNWLNSTSRNWKLNRIEDGRFTQRRQDFPAANSLDVTSCEYLGREGPLGVNSAHCA